MIEPQNEAHLRAMFGIARTKKIASGFYISQAMEVRP
jgi:hypothetical protein